jgi:hypothetical protein
VDNLLNRYWVCFWLMIVAGGLDGVLNVHFLLALAGGVLLLGAATQKCDNLGWNWGWALIIFVPLGAIWLGFQHPGHRISVFDRRAA